MQKKDDSLRSRGLTLVAVDKPLRADIKAQAAKQGVTMVEYLRSKVEQDKQADPQAIMVSNTAPATKADVKTLSDRMNAVIGYVFSGKLDNDVWSFVMSAVAGQQIDSSIVKNAPLVHPESKLASLSVETRQSIRAALDKADEIARNQEIQSGFELKETE